nr:MAG TPA: hypothetical protein [Caudoviricetes sp.]DAS36338.1 MAG TPA: hypothetical protein [Caudoviricetes sp.]DAV24515.1 MAG TPA: hypothetical protein [Caudoviricetes sp.]
MLFCFCNSENSCTFVVSHPLKYNTAGNRRLNVLRSLRVYF